MIDDFNHHAYLLVGEFDTVRSKIYSRLEEDLENPHSDPDVYDYHFDKLGISESKLIHELQSKKGLKGGKKFFLISFLRPTLEGQNSLLKVFEEPTKGTHFFLITPSKSDIIETLLSRVREIKTSKESYKNDDARNFLLSPVSERLSLIKNLDDESSILHFLDSLEEILVRENLTKIQVLNFVKTIPQTRRFIKQRGGSSKVALEKLAITTPSSKFFQNSLPEDSQSV